MVIFNLYTGFYEFICLLHHQFSRPYTTEEETNVTPLISQRACALPACMRAQLHTHISTRYLLGLLLPVPLQRRYLSVLCRDIARRTYQTALKYQISLEHT